jgi:hypothetical protein
MSAPPVTPTAPLVTLNGFEDPNIARMFGVVMALAGEVYVLKAEVERLKMALAENALVDDESLRRAEESQPMQCWLAEEQGAFTADILRPWLEPDAALDVRNHMAVE